MSKSGRGPHCRRPWSISGPELAEKAGILATPTLAYELPERSRRIVFDLSDSKRVLEFLGIGLKRNPT
jgi:circadian clock protein KaiB